MIEGGAIKLEGGPWHDTAVTDMGTDPLELTIAQPLADGRVRVGKAFYEPNEDRTVAFWLTNEWVAIRTNISE